MVLFIEMKFARDSCSSYNYNIYIIDILLRYSVINALNTINEITLLKCKYLLLRVLH